MLSVIANQPIDVPMRETLMFLTSRIPLGAEILEVGCGEGHVAGELLKHGYRVTALDSDPEVIARAQARGVPTMVASWPEFGGSASFDTIVFTRSLHHISPLREAIGRARELLKPMGSLLVEDFAFEDVDESTIGWFAKVVRATQAVALITPITDQLVTDLLSSTDVMDAWQRNRGHDLNSMAAMNEAIAERFVVDETWSVPYLYRYLIPVLAKTSKAAAFVNEVFEQEALLEQRSRGVLLGRRIVASLRANEMQTPG
jgi:2-polyprenyl-3-methyl-5-hydroxy-6-metoxy-1,4-benzoquinol methylase